MTSVGENLRDERLSRGRVGTSICSHIPVDTMITPGIAVVLVVVTAAAATTVCTAFHIPPRASGGSGRSNNLQQTKQYRHSNCLPCQRQALITRCSSGKAVDTEPDSKTEEVQMQGDGDQVEAEDTSEGDKVCGLLSV